MRTIIVIIAFLLTCLSISCQTTFGYIDYDSVIKAIPEYKISQEKIKIIESDLNDSLQLLNQQLDNFYYEKFHYVDYSWDSTLSKYFTDTIVRLHENISKFQEISLQKIDMVRKEELEFVNSLLAEIIKKFCIINDIDTLVDKNSLIDFTNYEDYTAELLLFIKSSLQE